MNSPLSSQKYPPSITELQSRQSSTRTSKAYISPSDVDPNDSGEINHWIPIAERFGLASANKSPILAPQKEKLIHWSELEAGLEELQKKKIFLVRLCKMLHSYGCPVRRLEANVQIAAKALGIHADFAILPFFAIAALGDPESEHSQTMVLRLVRGVDLSRQYYTELLVESMANRSEGGLEIGECLTNLDEIQAGKGIYAPYPVKLKLLAFSVFAFTTMVIVVGGWREQLVSAALAPIIIGGMTQFPIVRQIMGPILEAIAMLMVAFVAQALSSISSESGFCFWSIVGSTCLFIFPGVLVTVATLELTSGKVVNGVIKLCFALFIAMIEGIGIAAGEAAVWWSNSNTSQITCQRYQSEYWSILMYPFFLLSISILLNSNRKQWPSMWISSAFGFLVLKLVLKATPWTAIAILASAFTLSLTAQILHEIFGSRAKVIPSIYCGIWTLIPGSLGVRGGQYLLQQNYLFANQFFDSMLEFALSIAIGFFAAQPFIKLIQALTRKSHLKNMETF